MFNGISKEKFAELVKDKRLSLMVFNFYKRDLLDTSLSAETVPSFMENMKPFNTGKVTEINEEKLIRELDYYSFGNYRVIDKIGIKEASFFKEKNSNYFLVVTPKNRLYYYLYYLRIEK